MQNYLDVVAVGLIGKITGDAFELGSNVVAYDIADDSEYTREKMEACDFIVDCVGTPMSFSGGAYLSQVHGAFQNIPSHS